MVQVLGHQHLREQPGCGDPLVDHVRRHRRLDQGLALRACPLAADVALHREHARRVVQFLGHILADALECATAGAHRISWLVTELGAGQVRWQRCALGLLLGGSLGIGTLERLQLEADRLKVGLERLIEQLALIALQLLAAGRELPALENRHLVGELVDLELLQTVVLLRLGQLLLRFDQLTDHAGSELTQLICVHLCQLVDREHGHDRATSQCRRTSIHARLQAFLLRNPNRRAFADPIPRQSDHQPLELLDRERHLRARSRIGPYQPTLVQAPCTQPDTQTIVHQDLHASGPPIGKQVRMMRTRLAEHLDDAGQRRVRARTHVQRFNRHPHRIDTNHLSSSRTSLPDSPINPAGRLIRIVTLPFVISLRIGSGLSAGLATATGTKWLALF